MAFATWSEAVAELSKELTTSTPRQIELGESLGINIIARVPEGVAAARLRRALAQELGEKAHVPRPRQLEFLRNVAQRIRRRVPRCETSIEAAAWIHHYVVLLRVASLRQLKLTTGDIVVHLEGWATTPFEVSSIDRVGRVHFRGAMSAWPDKIEVIARAGDQGEAAQLARRDASNGVALIGVGMPDLSDAIHKHLARHRVFGEPGEEELDDLRRVVEVATDERPLQAFLKSYPQILTAALAGSHAQFVRPNVRLSASYEADFILGHADSLGLRWVLVELETPASRVTIKSAKDFDRQTRKGISQIREWRQWLQNNLASASRPESSDGLGLVGIRPNSRALVLVGRRGQLGPNADWLRQQLEENEQISVHTYDWLLERSQRQLEGRWLDSDRMT